MVNSVLSMGLNYLVTTLSLLIGVVMLAASLLTLGRVPGWVSALLIAGTGLSLAGRLLTTALPLVMRYTGHGPSMRIGWQLASLPAMLGWLLFCGGFVGLVLHVRRKA